MSSKNSLIIENDAFYQQHDLCYIPSDRPEVKKLYDDELKSKAVQTESLIPESLSVKQGQNSRVIGTYSYDPETKIAMVELSQPPGNSEQAHRMEDAMKQEKKDSQTVVLCEHETIHTETPE